MSARRADWQVPAHATAVYAPKVHEAVLIIPVINEGGRIRSQLRAIAGLVPPVDIVIADGGSTDGSLNEAFLRDTGIRACLTKTGPGRLSAQLRVGYAWALGEGYRHILTMDGNGKDGLDGIVTILEALRDGYDYVQGSRYFSGGRAINTPTSRWFAGRFIHAPVVSLAARFWFTDTTNGFRGYSALYLTDPELQPFRDVFTNYSLLFYLSIRASRLGYEVTEVGVTRTYPDGGQVPTKIGGLGGKLAILGELFRAATGGYDP